METGLWWRAARRFDGHVKSQCEVLRWLDKKFDIQGVGFWQSLDYTCRMSRDCQKPTTQEIGLFTTPSRFAKSLKGAVDTATDTIGTPFNIVIEACSLNFRTVPKQPCIPGAGDHPG